MKELKNHIAYELLETEYERVSLDYVILSFEGEETGVETHKNAVIEAFNIFNSRFSEFDYSVSFDKDKITCEKIGPDEFFSLPDDIDEMMKEGDKSFSIPEPLSYSFAFLMPPHGTNLKVSDFDRFNDMLFPDREELDIYRFSDDFSDYFTAGKEWWGTGLWTVLDRKSETVTVIAASLTD